MKLSEFGPAAALGAISLYLLLVCIIALIAAGHPDRRRRIDASYVLDRLLRILTRTKNSDRN